MKERTRKKKWVCSCNRAVLKTAHSTKKCDHSSKNLYFFLDEVSYQGKVLDNFSYSTKCLLDEISVSWNGLSTKWVSTKCRAYLFLHKSTCCGTYLRNEFYFFRSSLRYDRSGSCAKWMNPLGFIHFARDPLRSYLNKFRKKKIKFTTYIYIYFSRVPWRELHITGCIKGRRIIFR